MTMIEPLVAVFVPGRAKTKGSMRSRGNGSMYEAVNNKAWRAQVAELVGQDYRRRGAHSGETDGPVRVHCVFILPVDDAAAPRVGDIDKLLRLVLDALQDAGVFVDDTQVVSVTGSKIEQDDANVQGAWIIVSESTQSHKLSILTRLKMWRAWAERRYPSWPDS